MFMRPELQGASRSFSRYGPYLEWLTKSFLQAPGLSHGVEKRLRQSLNNNRDRLTA